ncbi:hypothetical protein ACFFU8_08960 [Chromobacterium piscinae]|uniref:plasmid mobilization protein n=1 Tax=Chromobacterium piscinae TaxID=686831 RepID=UPI001E397663|nr:hypothetical protein [Chromobacterium piscinae]MCD5327967.1 hypothetical protein [Chromobacterium piscinae]
MARGFKKKAEGTTATTKKEIRLTKADLAEIMDRAGKAQLTFSEYMRRCALGRRTDMRYDVDAINALRHVADLLRLFHQDPRVHLPEEDVRAALIEVVQAIKRV